jgi:hypothetical protein
MLWVQIVEEHPMLHQLLFQADLLLDMEIREDLLEIQGVVVEEPVHLAVDLREDQELV